MTTISHVVSSTSEVNQITSEVIFAPDRCPLRGRSLQRWAIRRFVGQALLTLRLLKCTSFGGGCSLSFVMLHLRGRISVCHAAPTLQDTFSRKLNRNSRITANCKKTSPFLWWGRSFMYFCNARGGINLQRPTLVPTKLFFSLVFLLEDFIPNRSLDGMVFDKASHTPHGVPEGGFSQ